MKLDTKKLQLAMARKQMSVKELAEVSGLSKNSISSFLTGRRTPCVKSIGKLAKGLDVDVTEILLNGEASD